MLTGLQSAEVTDEFLDFTASRGNDLRTVGLTGGCKWCLCVSRWMEALAARKNDQDAVVPKSVSPHLPSPFPSEGRSGLLTVDGWFETCLLTSRLCLTRVFLNATHEKALEKVDLADLQKFAADKEA